MSPDTAAARYKEAAIDSAPPVKIVQLLYEAAIRHIGQAREIDPAADPRAFGERLRRADAIVAELRMALDPRPAPELAAQLNSLYLFVERQLQESLIAPSTEPLVPALDVLQRLLAGWRGVQATGAR
jgi:flagellar protein FliS